MIKQVNNEVKELIKDFKYGWAEFFKYEIVAKIILSILIMPIFVFFINVLMRNRGFSVITNNQILKFGFSKQGVLSLIILYIMSVFIILIEIGGIIAIGNRVITRNKNIQFFSVLRFCLIKVKRFIGVGGIFAVLFFIVFTNFIGIEPYSVLGIPLELPEFIQSYINESACLSIIQVFIIILLIILFIRWIFTFHFIILDNKKAVEALKDSSKLVKRNWSLVVKNFIIIFILNTIMISVFYGLWIVLIPRIIYHVNYTSYCGKVFIAGLFLLRKLGTILAFLIVTPIQIHWITRLFYLLKLKKNNEKIVPINLTIKKTGGFLERIFLKRKTIIIIIIFIFTISSLTIGLVVDALVDTMYNVKITAHRGNVIKAPENTLASINEAINGKADFAEIDVQASKDGKIFLSHDFNFKRVTGVNKNSWELNYSQIEKLDVGSHFSRKFKGEKIPLLEEVIDLAKDKIKLNIEIKDNGHEKDLVEKVVGIIENKDFVKSCVVTSLDYNILQQVKKINPKIKTGYIIYLAKGNLQDLNIDFYSVEESLVSNDLIYMAHSSGKQVHVWTVNNDENMKKMIEIGIDNIITDNPEMLREWINSLKNKSPYEKFLDIIVS